MKHSISFTFHCRYLKIILCLLALSFIIGCSILNQENTGTTFKSSPPFNISIPTGGNTWVIQNGNYTTSDIVTKAGIRNWNTPNQTIRTFFYLKKAGNISLGIKAKVPSGGSTLTATFQNNTKTITLQETGFLDTYIGDFQVDSPGYYFVDLAGVEKTGPVYADIADLLLGGIPPYDTRYIKDDFYFARRGPSVHLNFPIPEEIDHVEWFYSELMIPEGEDVIGSYFMANGFGEGYFGIQVNSPSERKILFSVWSPYQTDNPADIPEDYKIKLIKKGNGVTTGEFGNEGSGGQSFKVFNWKTDVNYGFLVGAKPTGNGSTDYTAYFFDPETNIWNLIAQFRRPKTTTYLQHLYSFLENFIPDQGVKERMGLYGNQWVHDGSRWHELTQIRFTADNTARKENRLDYSGGISQNQFYLKNCGFSNDKTLIDSVFERNRLGKAPNIPFPSLN